jgi:mono/diheme cytochrome c family protein
MKTFLLVVGVLLLAGFSLSYARQNTQENPDKAKADDSKVPADAAAKVNPVKSSAEGLAEARKVFGYDCEMCHGAKGDGKGDVVESMQLTMHDWHNPATLANMTDGEIFYIITKGKGKMMAEGERVPEKLRWNLVNLVRAMAAKGSDQKTLSAATTNP